VGGEEIQVRTGGLKENQIDLPFNFLGKPLLKNAGTGKKRKKKDYRSEGRWRLRVMRNPSHFKELL